jgi:hypothetical protein
VLREIDFGGHPTVFQQYSANRAAVNVESEGPIDRTKLTKAASEYGVELEMIET